MSTFTPPEGRPGETAAQTRICVACGGTGKREAYYPSVTPDTCRHCYGSGRVKA